MRLIVGNQPVAIPSDATITLERLSPALNKEVGSFSYPFSVPTAPNQRILGWPGKLERIGDIPSKSFILMDSGFQVLRGTLEYDAVSEEEIGIILKSGSSEFYSNVRDDSPETDGSYLSSVDFGREDWFGDTPVTIEQFVAKLSAWDIANRAQDAPFVVAPFRLTTPTVPVILGNKHTEGGFLHQSTWLEDVSDYYMLQFKTWYVLEKIFQQYGYRVILDELKQSEFSELVILTRPFAVTATEVDLQVFTEALPNDRMIFPRVPYLTYGHLMPEVKITDFLTEMKTLMGLTFDIDDLNKTVRIIQLKSIINSTQTAVELTELKGWSHKESPGSSASDGYSLSFAEQQDPLDNRSDFTINRVFANDDDYFGVADDEIFTVTSLARDYLTVRLEVDVVYRQIGRLKPMTSGKEKNQIEFNVMVPQNVYGNDLQEVSGGPLFTGPRISLSNSMQSQYFDMGFTLYEMPKIFVSIYRGTVTNALITTIPFQIAPMPLLSADQWNLSETLWLSPAKIYELIYADFLSWQTSGARQFTKYLQMTLPELISLQWGKRYFISGVKSLLSKITYDLPFTGIVRVDGYVV